MEDKGQIVIRLTILPRNGPFGVKSITSLLFTFYFLPFTPHALVMEPGSKEEKSMKYVFDTKQVKRYQFPTHINDLVMDRAESTTSEAFIVVLQPGEAPPPHKHDDTEQVFYVLEGKGRLTIGDQDEQYPVEAGNLVRIPPSALHCIEADGDEPLRYLAVDCFVGGRPEEEPTWDSHVKVICRNEGWDYDRIVK